jgi:phage-related protein
MSFNNLAVGEVITINCSNEDVQTSLPGMYRFDNMTGDFIDLDLGDNSIQINGNISVQLKYEFKYL